ncbi:MAG: FAD-binding protein [Salinirussus sp.]
MEDPDRQADVVVVGGGGAGMTAAIAAAETVSDVLILEADDSVGGVTARAIGSYSVAETPHQRDAGVSDSVQAHFDDIDKFIAEAAAAGRYDPVTNRRELVARDRPDLRRLMVERGPDTFDWLRDLGLEYSGPHPEPPHRVPRMHNVQPNTRAVELETPARDLLMDGRRVVGVRDADGGIYAAHGGVILATGGYYANQALRTEFTADDTAPPFAEFGSGAGQELAREVGAELVNMDLLSRSFRVGGPLWTSPELGAIAAAGGAIVTPEGDRFVNELSDHDQLFDATRDAGGTCYAVFDGQLAERFSGWPDYLSTFPGIAYGYVDDYAETEYLASGETLADLAAATDMQPAVLEEAIEEFNAAARWERPDRFGRMDFTEPLVEPPFYALGPIGTYALITDGGVAVNTRLEALDGDGAPIRGLYAVGDTAGGPLRVGHGHHHLWLFNSARTAGEEAAAAA